MIAAVKETAVGAIIIAAAGAVIYGIGLVVDWLAAERQIVDALIAVVVLVLIVIFLVNVARSLGRGVLEIWHSR